MLEVSLNLADLAAMILGIVVPVAQLKVDALNSTAAKPILGGNHGMVTPCANFKRWNAP